MRRIGAERDVRAPFTPKEALAANVVVYRARKRLSQTELAELVGISRPTVSRIERCEGDPTLDVLSRIAAALNVDIAELFSTDIGPEFSTNAELERRAAGSREGSVNARVLFAAMDESAGKPGERAFAERYSNAGRPRVER
jgi:transcriptional regulator with XRE-family HTH domain